jgi:Dolichyl-phosphate-mannose-protein mannosyltransferase
MPATLPLVRGFCWLTLALVAKETLHAISPAVAAAVVALAVVALVASGLWRPLRAWLQAPVDDVRDPSRDTDDVRNIAILGLFAFCVRLASVLLLDTRPTSDSATYVALGEHLCRTGSYGLHGPSAYAPVGIPALVAAVSCLDLPVPLAMGILNALCEAATLPAIYLAGREAAGQRVGVAASLLWVAWPSRVLGTALVSTESVFTLLMTWALVCCWKVQDRERWLQWAVAAGVLLGAASHVRANALPVPWVLLALYAIGEPRSFPARLVPWLTVGGVTVAVLVPWGLRNYAELGQFLLTTSNAGLALLPGNFDGATGGYVELPFVVPGGTELEKNRAALRLAIGWMLEHPTRFAALVLPKWQALLSRDTEEVGWALLSSHLVQWTTVVKVASQIFYTAALALAAVGSVRLRSVRASAALLPGLAIALAWLALHMFFHGQSRYHAPLVPLLCVLAAAGWVRACRTSEGAKPHSNQDGATHS